MSDRERQSRELSEFPRVSKEIVELLIEDMEGSHSLINTATDEMLRNDRWITIAVVSKELKEMMEGLIGASFVYAAFEQLKKDGINLPPVSKETVEAFLEEASQATTVLDLLERVDLSKEERLQKFKQGMKEVETNFPSPFLYCDENPALMVRLAQQKGAFSNAGFLVYELKRRQFMSDRMSEKFGSV